MTFKDHFSRQSADYTRFRPRYPADLFAYLAGLPARRERAWDCATGNGQAALGLAPHFAEVVATDASEQQIAQAMPRERVHYRVAPAEASGLDTGSMDLVTVAQALHWFELDRFHAEVMRVLRPGGAVAVWCYQLTRITPAVDAVINRFYAETVGPFWPPERVLVEQGYRTLPFPFVEQSAPAFAMRAEWNLDHLLGYLGTWSAVQACRQRLGADPLDVLRRELAPPWGDPAMVREVRWPLSLRVGHRPTAPESA